MLNHEIIGSGNIVLVVHGLFGNLNNLKTLSNYLSKFYKVVSVDLANHGGSKHCREATIESMANDLHELICCLGVDKVNLVGHSLGGKVTMKYSQLYPSIVEKLVVVDIAPVSYPNLHRSVFSALNSIDLNAIVRKDNVLALLNKSGLDPKICAFLIQSLIEHENGFKWEFNLDGLEASYPQLMGWDQKEGKYYGPSLFIKGELSDYIRHEHEVIIKQTFPKASIKVVEGAGHWLHVEKVREFNGLVKGFL